jgi:hypothetical protein
LSIIKGGKVSSRRVTGSIDWPAVLDGRPMLAAEATIPVLDDGLTRGDGER